MPNPVALESDNTALRSERGQSGLDQGRI